MLRPGHDFERDLPMSEYALISRALLHRCFGFDVTVAERDTHLYRTYVEFFSRVREAPEMRKKPWVGNSFTSSAAIGFIRVHPCLSQSLLKSSATGLDNARQLSENSQALKRSA